MKSWSDAFETQHSKTPLLQHSISLSQTCMVSAKAYQFKHFETIFVTDHSAQIKFAADRMLGRLAKWLRILGQDVVYGPHLSGYGLVRAARKENRLVLTRDRALKKKQPPAVIFIESDDYREQLRQVIQTCQLQPLRTLFSRCLACNSPLRPRAKESVKEVVPSYVFSTQEKFHECPLCRRVYWPATHYERMLEELRQMGIAPT